MKLFSKYLILSVFIINSCNVNKGYEKITLDVDGKILEKRIYPNSNDTLDFVSYSYNEYGNIKSIRPYRNNLLDGNVLDYYKNGQLNIITPYVADTLFGVNKVFAEDGELVRKSLYIDGKQVLFEQLFINRDLGMKKNEIYEVDNGKGDKVGQIVYENGKIKKDWSLYCFMQLDDTVSSKREYFVEIEAITEWEDGYLEADIYQLNRNAKELDNSKIINIRSKTLKSGFTIKPCNLGINILLGRAYIKKDTIINGEANTLKLIVPFYKEFYVTDINP